VTDIHAFTQRHNIRIKKFQEYQSGLGLIRSRSAGIKSLLHFQLLKSFELISLLQGILSRAYAMTWSICTNDFPRLDIDESKSSFISRVRKSASRFCLQQLFNELPILNKPLRQVIIDYMHRCEPDLVRQCIHRIRRRLKRCQFWAARVNDMWCGNQHNKLKKYGLALHTGNNNNSIFNVPTLTELNRN
jgi:hypothetical protein